MVAAPPNITEHAVTLLGLQPKYCKCGSFHAFEWLETTLTQTTPTTYHILPISPFTVSPPLVAALSVAKQLPFFCIKKYRNLVVMTGCFKVVIIYRISRPIRHPFFSPEKCDLNSTCALCAEGKYYFQTYKYPYSYYITRLS